MCAKVLVVEDEEAISQLLAYNLQKEGFTVATSADGDEALIAVDEEKPDLVLLDWMLPNVSGIELCRQLRTPQRDPRDPGHHADRPRRGGGPRARPRDRRRRLRDQALLHVRAGRAHARRPAPHRARAGRRRGDLRRHRARPPALPGAPRQARHPSRADRVPPARRADAAPGPGVRREQLLDRVWGQDVYVEIRTVDVHVGRLRKALNRRGDRDPIRTVRSSGYALDETYAG